MNESLKEKVAASIQRIQNFEPPEGYWLAFSGGKDSVVCKALMEMAGVKYETHYRLTSVDPPELVRFIKQQHPDVHIDLPRYSDTEKDERFRGKQITMWNLIVKKAFLPTRIARYCCAELKEDAGDGRLCVTGVRWAESTARKKSQGIATVVDDSVADDYRDDDNFRSTPRGGVVLVNDNDDSRRAIENCYKRGKVTLNPIIDWTDSDVWSFIRDTKTPYCSLYDEGFTRLGCIGCPMATQKWREREFSRWPKYKDAYMRAFEKMLTELKNKGKPWKRGETAQDVFNWWMEYDILPGQVTFEDMEVEE